MKIQQLHCRLGCILRKAGAGLGSVFLTASLLAAHPDAIVLQNAHVRYSIGTNGTNLEFTDRATGNNYLRRDAPSVCAWVRAKGLDQPATSVSLTEDRLTLAFGSSGAKAVLRTQSRDSYIRLTVESVTGAEADSLVFLNVPLTLDGRPGEPFGACAFSLNLITRVDALPALQRDLRASSHRKFGLAGAKAAIVAVPMEMMLPALKEVLTDADEMPRCPVAGPWAREVPFNHGSYLFNFGSLTESTVDQWIAMARSLGVTQIDHHGGSAFFRFGDFELNRKKWPDGWVTFQRLVQRLHDAGIGSIFHTYGFFIDKQSKYVSPVPDKRLDAFRTFSLAAAVSPDATELVVNESTKGLSTVTGFFEHNSVVLHLDDELVAFGTVSQEPPWRFGGLKRGVFGTQAASHEKGTKARQLKECFGLFVPDVESSLFEEIARNHAELVNACGFDGIYLDAIDGSSILRGADECWYWADKFVFEIQRHLRKPVGMEMSAMWHHFWQYRTRWQAWDYPQRGHKRFIDLHAESVNGGLLLPLHLGWWNFQSFNPPQIEPTYPDVIEYLGAKLIGWDAGISLTGAIDSQRLKDVPLFRRAVDILRHCEELRRGGSFTDAARAELRKPGREFSLVRDSAGTWRLRPARADAHTVSAAEPWTLSWKVENTFDAQPLRFRLEALMSTTSYDDPENIILAGPSSFETFSKTSRAAEGVTASLKPIPQSTADKPSVLMVAANSGKVPRLAAWARFDRKFEPVLNLKNHEALGLTVEGDALGEIIAVRLESPRHLSFGAAADRYLNVDFSGRRIVTLVETESARWSDYVWNDGKSLYNVYRETIDFGRIESVSLWYNNLPPGRETRCAIGTVKALRMVPCVVRNPAVTLNGRTLVLLVEIPAGGFVEFEGPSDCTLYGPKGEALAKVKALEPTPELRRGPNQVQFSCDPSGGPSPRARLVVLSQGDLF
ncbi:MAG: hypothetical protein HY735_37200 [Verrucomicrobia bacterium]|nr:hypothetical protein [Verrucomicrobiota bacterium]